MPMAIVRMAVFAFLAVPAFSAQIQSDASPMQDGERSVRGWKFTAVDRQVPPTASAVLPGIGTVFAFYYPGMNRVRVELLPTNGVSVASAAVRLSGKSFSLLSDGTNLTALADVPAGPGKWPIDVEVSSGGKRHEFQAACKLDRTHFEWEGHHIGKDRIILPPFKSISGTGEELSVLLCKYRLGGAGLPASIVADGRELLAEPVRFEASVGGKKVVFRGMPAKVRMADDGYDAAIDGAAEADGMTIRAKGCFEYDGFLYSEFCMSGTSGRKIDRLTLVVPMKDAEVPLMHVCMADSLRSNPAGRVPEGDGEVWNGTMMRWPKVRFHAPQLAPYAWLGAERRGLSWFVNNTCGFRLDGNAAAMRLVRANGVLRLEIDVINVPSVLPDGHAFSFGFEATPVKEPDPALKRHFQTGPGAHPVGMVSRLAVNYAGIGFWNNWARRPYGDDWELFKAACRLVNNAGPDDAAAYRKLFRTSSTAHEKELEEYCRPLPTIGKSTPYYLWLKGCRLAAAEMIQAPGETAYPFKYSDPTLNWTEEPAQKAFRSEWVSRSNQYTGAERNFLVDSYLDYIIYYYKKEVDLGMKGIYLDDMFPMTCRNPDTCCRIDSDCSVHGNFGILEMRELVKRLSVMQHKAGVSPRLLQVHMTNCLLVPAFAFATSQLSWEDHFGEDEFQKRFKDDYIRAESLGGQIGAEAVALDGIKRFKHPKEGWDARFRFLTRTQQAMLLPAGVKLWLRPPWPPQTGVHKKELFSIMETPGGFGAWESDCRFTPYYAYDGSAGAMPPGIHVGTWRRNGRVLWVFGNQTANDIEIAVTPTGERLTVPAYDLRFAQSAENQACRAVP